MSDDAVVRHALRRHSLHALAEAGDVASMTALGWMYWRGDPEEARAWWERAAEAGDIEAMKLMARLADGDLESMDRPAEVDAEAAADWYRRAAAAGDSDSMISLAQRLAGLGRHDEAEEWFRHAIAVRDASRTASSPGWLSSSGERWDMADLDARRGLADVLVRLGRHGEAEGWYRRAAEEGDVAAARELARLLEARDQVAEARRWRDWANVDVPWEGGTRAAPADLPAIVATAVVTAAIVPFVQTLVSKAAADGYDAVRALLDRMFRDHRQGRAGGDPDDGLLIVLDPRTAAVLNLRPRLPDDAIRALEALDVDALLAERPQKGRMHLTWNAATGMWEVRTHSG